MLEILKKYFEMAGNVINKLPFKKLLEKYSDKIPILKNIAPFANFTVCGLVVVLVIVKILVPQVKFNNFMAKIEQPWKDEIERYENLDFTDDYKSAFDKIVTEITECSNDRNGLTKIAQVKLDSENKLDEIRVNSQTKLDEVNNAFDNIENLTFPVMSTKQFNKYKKAMEILPKRATESWANCFSKNETLYDNYKTELDKLCSAKIEKISEAIKEADRKAYIDFIHKSLIGDWADNHKETNINFSSNGTFLFYYYRKARSPKLPPKSMYLDDGTVQISLLNRKDFSRPERLRKFSGKYSFKDDVVVLDVTSATYKNTPKISSGDQLRIKISFSNNGDTLWFDGKTYKRER